MTFNRFEEILHVKFPNAEAVPHGKFGGTESNNKVTIMFNEYGKCYEYYGSYQAILNSLGIHCLYKADISNIQSRLQFCKENHGKLGLFGKPRDYSKEIEYLELYLQKINSNDCIIID